MAKEISPVDQMIEWMNSKFKEFGDKYHPIDPRLSTKDLRDATAAFLCGDIAKADKIMTKFPDMFVRGDGTENPRVAEQKAQRERSRRLCFKEAPPT